MPDIRNMILEELRKDSHIQTSAVNETEEIVDTKLPITDENLQQVALQYLTERGYQKRQDNLERAKEMIRTCSKDSETLHIRKKRVVEKDLFADATMEELRDAINVCLLETVESLNAKLKRMYNPQYEYLVHSCPKILTEDDRPKRHLQDDFRTFEELLDCLSLEGWELFSVHQEGTTPSTQRAICIFRRAKFDD